nr:GTP-binding protein [Fibrobacter succinogenes]
MYYRRTPMNRNKLRAFVKDWPKDIIRCKGLMWFGDEYDTAYVFETSGRQLLCGPYGKWIASAPASQRKQILAENPSIREDWDDQVGDRMIRLCIIGKNLNRKAIAAQLDELLCKENEIIR